MLLRNPKDGKEISSELSELAAVEICEKQNSTFPRGLARQWRAAQNGGRALSPSQYFWLFKLAEDNKPTPEPEAVQLFSNLQEFISCVPTMQFRVELEDGEKFGKVLLRTKSDAIIVQSGYRDCGHIIADKFFPSRYCWNKLTVQLMLFSANPRKWMEDYGKATGYCCVCGRELTNEESVSCGIGPICRERFGF